MVPLSLNENGRGAICTPMLVSHVHLALAAQGHCSNWSWSKSGLASAGNVRPWVLQAVRMLGFFVSDATAQLIHLRNYKSEMIS